MHDAASHFMRFIQNALPEAFENKRVLDVGSGDINGNNRGLFTNCEYHGNDVAPARNVTIVCRTKDLLFENESFDTIVSTECFEHDPEYKDSWRRVYEMLKPGGLFVFTCATTGRPEHGTRRTSPGDSIGTMYGISGMSDYYKNLTVDDIEDVFDVDTMFSTCMVYYNYTSHDMYFVGIKNDSRVELPRYVADDVELVASWSCLEQN